MTLEATGLYWYFIEMLRPLFENLKICSEKFKSPISSWKETNKNETLRVTRKVF